MQNMCSAVAVYLTISDILSGCQTHSIFMSSSTMCACSLHCSLLLYTHRTCWMHRTWTWSTKSHNQRTLHEPLLCCLCNVAKSSNEAKLCLATCEGQYDMRFCKCCSLNNFSSRPMHVYISTRKANAALLPGCPSLHIHARWCWCKLKHCCAHLDYEYPATRNRTRDHLIAAANYSQMLYQLSYSRSCSDLTTHAPNKSRVHSCFNTLDRSGRSQGGSNSRPWG